MKYKLKENYLGYSKDSELFEFSGNTWGILDDDTDLLGEPCVALSKEKGKNPFVVIPLSKLDKLDS